MEQLTPEAADLWRQLEAARRELGNLRRRNEELTAALAEVRDAVENLDAPTIGGRLVGTIAPLSAQWRAAA